MRIWTRNDNLPQQHRAEQQPYGGSAATAEVAKKLAVKPQMQISSPK